MSYDPIRDPVEGPILEDEDEERADTPLSEMLMLSLAELFYPIYKRLFSNREKYITRLETKLSKANIQRPVEIYLSGAIAVGSLIGGFLMIAFAGLLFLAAPNLFPIPATPASAFPQSDTAWMSALIEALNVAKYLFVFSVIGTVGALLGTGTAIWFAQSLAKIRAYQRRREIELLLPGVIAFMYSLSVGGMDQLEVMDTVADTEDTYGEVAVEFRRITQRMWYFKTDYRTAINNVSKTTPSDNLSKFLNDMLSITNSGGDLTQFLEVQKDYYMEETKRKQERYLETLEMFGEMYMSLAVLPMLLIVVLLTFSMFAGPVPNLIMMITYALIPVLNIMFIVLIAIIKQDEVGSGRLEPPDDSIEWSINQDSLSALGAADEYATRTQKPVFKRVQSYEFRHRLKKALSNPLRFLRLNGCVEPLDGGGIGR